MKYIVASTMVSDIIHLPGQQPHTAGGGAGLYAYCGMRLWSSEVLQVTGVGADLYQEFGSWISENQVDTSGFYVRTEHNPKNIIQYYDDGSRTETPRYGIDHYRLIEPTAEDIGKQCSDCRGLYVFRNIEDSIFWEKLLELKDKYGFTLMWEIAADAALPEKRGQVTELLKHIDLFSINEAETSSLFSTDADQAMKYLMSLNIPLVYYRKGVQGALLVTPEKIVSAKPVRNVMATDPTGCGNSSSGAVLVGWCQNRSLNEIGQMGSIAAGFALAQYGPPHSIGADAQKKANQMLERNMSNGT